MLKATIARSSSDDNVIMLCTSGFVNDKNVFFINLAPSHIFAIGESRHFKFRVLIDTKES